MSASCQSIDSMFEVRPIGTRTKFKPVKKPTSEIPSVELVTDLVEVELEDLRFYVMVSVHYAPLGIADDNVYPCQYFPDTPFVVRNDGMMGGCHPVLFKGDIAAEPVRGHIGIPVRTLLNLARNGGRLEIVDDLHLYMPDTLGRTVLLGRRRLGQTAFRHDKDRGLALASPSALQRAIFLFFRRFRGKEALVNLHVPMEGVTSVALTHHVAQLMHHLPYGLVTLAANLTLYLLGGYGTLGRRQKEHGSKPVTDRQMAALHHRTGTKLHLMFAIHARPGLVARIPAQAQTAALTTEQAVMLTETTKGFLTGCLVGILTVKIKQVHNAYVYCFTFYILHKVFQNMVLGQLGSLNFANLVTCGHSFFILNPAPGNSSAFSPLCDEQPGAYEDNIRTKRMFASGYLNVNILKDFFFKSTIGIDVTDSREGIYKDKNTVANLGVKSTSSVQADNDWRYTWENILNYSKTFGKHGLTAMIGSSTTAYGYEKVLASGANQASALTSFHDLGANADSKENASQLIETQMVSFFGRLNYKFNERYLFQASLRADGSSVLAKGHKWGYFPSASAAWRISEEGFMADQDIFSNLKLRLSWGVAGNSAIDAYATLGGLKKSVYTFGSSVYGYYPSEIANKDLTWEKTSTWNLGLDFSILRNRISGTIDTYISQTSDLLLPSLLPSSTGYASVMQNIGKTENKGIEVTLNTIWFQNKNFSWNTDWTYSLNREKIKALNSGVTRDEGNLWFVGSPTQVFYDYKKIGIWQLGEEVQAKAFGGFKPGDIKVADMSPKGSEGEGVFSTDDRVIFSRVPKYTFGITNNIIYKNFDLMFFIYGRIGQYVKDAYTQLYKPSALENSAPVNYWTPENPSNEYPRPNSGYSTNSYLLQSSLAFRKASFVKIRDITLGYTLPKEWTSKMMVQKLRIYCSLNNFITFTDFPNYDPESNGSMDFPLAKQVLFGINLSL